MANPGDTSAAFCATLVDEWVRAGVRHAMVSPGSRSTPLAVALASRPEVRLHIFHDERSAGFAALGAGRAAGFPAVVLCTSGTAAAHFAAAVHEAHLSRVPMIVCTADRPPELRDVSAPQTIDQTMMYGSAVRWFHDPGVPAEDARHSWRSLARRAVAASVGTLPGPVHLNLPFREPLLGSTGELPPPQDAHVRRATLGTRADDIDGLRRAASARRGVVIAGRGSGPGVLEFASRLGWPVLADATSGARTDHGNVVLGFDPVLRSERFAASHLPEVVVRVGDLPASKVLSQWVARSGAEVIQLTGDEAVVDPDHAVSRVVTGPLTEVLSAASVPGIDCCDSAWLADWRRADAAAQHAIDQAGATGTSEFSAARAVTRACRPGSNLVVSSSMPIRDVEWYGTSTEGVVVHSNRGANGIDGVVSTAVGIALVTGAPTVLYTGDIAFIHDTNGLWGLGARGVELTVVVTNNDGGSIFSFLPQASQVDGATFELLYGTPHGVDIASLAHAHGISHVSVTSATALQAEVSAGGTKIVEFRTDRHANVAEHDLVNAAVAAAVDAATA